MLFLETNSESIVYRGEGNQSLVVALKKNRKVIKLLKDINNIQIIESTLSQHIRFVEHVIPRLFGHHFFAVPELVRLSSSQVKIINQLVRDKRPVHRLEKNISSFGETFALILPDYCCLPKTLNHFQTCGPVIAVEIKPKQGFLPDSTLLAGELRIKSSVGRYCLSQYHKLQKGSIDRRSQYCPLDLFSGCPTRMEAAISALIEDPQNNFRVFKDIHLSFGDDVTTSLNHVINDFVINDDKRETFCRLVSRALTLAVDTNANVSRVPRLQTTCQLHTNRCVCDSKDHALPVGSVLEAVLRAQRLDVVDSQKANEMLDAISALEDNNNGAEEEEEEEEEWQVAKDTESLLELWKRLVWQFVVSLTAKDCSIMISMQRLLDSACVPADALLVEKDERYLVSIKVTDLVPKPRRKVRRTLSNDLRMVRAYNSSHFVI